MLSLASIAACAAVATNTRKTSGMWYLWKFDKSAPNVGTVLNMKWSRFETSDGVFDWKQLDKMVGQNIAGGKQTWLSFATGLSAPDYLRTVNVALGQDQWCASPLTPSMPGIVNETFPDYESDFYSTRWQRFVTTALDHIRNSWSVEWRESLTHLGFGIGSTGDPTPWHGSPWNSSMCINQTTWAKYWAQSSLYVATAARKLAKQTSVRVDFGYLPEELLPKITGILGNSSVTLNAHERCKTYQQTADALDIGQAVYQDTHSGRAPFLETTCWWDKFTSEGQTGSAQNQLYWTTLAWSLFSGVDSLVGPGCNSSTPVCRSMSMFFNKYAGLRNVEPSGSGGPGVGVWTMLHTGLDAGDVQLWPEAQYGKSSRSNSDRMVKIAESLQHQGAGQDDPVCATKSPQFSRRRKGLNDVGWQIHTGNYYSGIQQVTNI